MRRSSIFFRLASFLCCFSALARSRSRALRAAAGTARRFHFGNAEPPHRPVELRFRWPDRFGRCRR